MTELAVVTGVGGLVAVGFVAWQIGWRRRLESSLRRIPVRGAAFGSSSTRVADVAPPHPHLGLGATDQVRRTIRSFLAGTQEFLAGV